jgi:cell division septation protein DedD
LAQDDYYYEIQLTNKQLVFYFMAGATGLILSFLAGVMVGRGVDGTAGEVQAARPPAEERIVSEEPVAHPATPPPAEELTYAQRLEGDKPEEAGLEGRRLAPAGSLRPAKGPTPAPTRRPPARPTPAPASRLADAGAAPAPATKPPDTKSSATTPAAKGATVQPSAKPPTPSQGAPPSFTIQVGAFKDRATAESVVSRLKAKGYPAAYVVAPEAAGSGLYNVRVGSYPARADAERVQAKLRDQLNFKPFIVKN